jgi:hypothetical protein
MLNINTNEEYHDYNKINLVFSDNIYLPESVLSSWLNVSIMILTSSLLFYHMSQVHSLKFSPVLSKIIAVGLILVSTMYMVYAFISYVKRMNYTISKCKYLKECSKDQLNGLIFLKNSYLVLGLCTSVIQTMIVYLIII